MINSFFRMISLGTSAGRSNIKFDEWSSRINLRLEYLGVKNCDCRSRNSLYSSTNNQNTNKTIHWWLQFFDIHLKMLRSAQYQGIVTSMLILYAESLSLVTWYDLIVDFRRKRKCIRWCDVFRTETERLMILFTGESKIFIKTDDKRILTET